ncbi:Co2+/Mg2+ efflux protein ApaG [Sphingobacterium wenxiniae]|uniref:ApaG protein n=1 Tax=Sphingobacterium wenxiniae TaxID=683125 RepID=A0A1I6SD40_9SPHI|nr:Co2+/Mg2+ efflux protein ApaG [Sphingobacterium wenxiniae]SFS74857.1 ApaG protein [Sphingobacterium wenxiniae]
MTTQITEGVRISVEQVYQQEYSNPSKQHFMFSYRITIENLGHDIVQLISRHWDIFDSLNDTIQVDGEGVVGEQPILEPGETHQYISGCNLKSEIGYMEGYYMMSRLKDGSLFTVEIPRFNLVASYKLN